jgi:putative transposase
MSKKNVPVVRLVDRDEAAELPELSEELRAALTEVVGAAREGLLAMSVGVGLRVFAEMMDEELTATVGRKHAKLPGRTASWHGTAPGSVVLGGRRVHVERPRARTTDGSEVACDTYTAFASDDLLTRVEWSGCWPVWPPAGIERPTNQSAPRLRRPRRRRRRAR